MTAEELILSGIADMTPEQLAKWLTQYVDTARIEQMHVDIAYKNECVDAMLAKLEEWCNQTSHEYDGGMFFVKLCHEISRLRQAQQLAQENIGGMRWYRPVDR